ncbi:MAG: hypothetical protein CM15mP125_3790 [Gammaproteobacteria bacterium]|nr:MAG: hypothetical protein CM15mP125_3790 [Gammaproteobacteria bacterium]
MNGQEDRAGGAGNVAVNLAELGCQSRWWVYVGR